MAHYMPHITLVVLEDMEKIMVKNALITFSFNSGVSNKFDWALVETVLFIYKMREVKEMQILRKMLQGRLLFAKFFN